MQARAAIAVQRSTAIAAVMALLTPSLGADSAAAGVAADRTSARSAKVVTSGRLQGLRYHVVASGEGLSAIARRYRVDLARIKRANGIVRDGVYRGARLLLDEPNPTAPLPGWGRMGDGGASSTGSKGSTSKGSTSKGSAPTVPATHTVASGDTLERIARRYGTTIDALLAANHLQRTSVIRLGEELSLAPAAAAAPASPATHTVASGDTLERIARRYGTTLDALMAANHLQRTSVIRLGQALSLPAGAAPTATPASSKRTTASKVSSSVRCPVPGATFAFDWGFPREGGRFHEGTDMFAPAGTPIVAPVAGTISYDRTSISGISVTLRGADGWQYFGAHLSKQAKRKSSTVKAGDVIGYVGDTGDAAGGPTHLHLEMRPLDGRPTNPYPFLSTLCRR